MHIKPKAYVLPSVMGNGNQTQTLFLVILKINFGWWKVKFLDKVNNLSKWFLKFLFNLIEKFVKLFISLIVQISRKVWIIIIIKGVNS